MSMPNHTRTVTTRVSTRWLAVFSAALFLVTVVFVGELGSAPAQALNLPTWSDVQAAKKNQASATAKVKEIKGLIVQGEAELERLREESAKASVKADTAEEVFQAAAYKSDQLDKVAKASQKEAAVASVQAASLVSQMYRSGGVDRSLELFLETHGDTADALLERLAAMSKATERNTRISEEAEQSMNTASSLGEQAKVARAKRETLSEEAEKAAKVAAQAAAAQLEKINEQQEQQVVLKAQLAALQDTATKTVSGYRKRLKVEAEARRKAEAAARKAAVNGSGGGGSSAGGGGGTGGGWVSPIRYTYISTYFRQYSPYQSGGHTGVDLVNGCGTPIVAPKSGTVSFAGWKDSMGGNMVYLNHSSSYQTRFAHMQSVAVSYGQYVRKGQIIGYVGTSGASLGCHLHYELLRYGSFRNPINYL